MITFQLGFKPKIKSDIVATELLGPDGSTVLGYKNPLELEF